MTAQTDPYVRVYYRVIDDARFETVYDDDARLACWLRLLLIADGTYPAPAPIPAGVRRSAFNHLVTVGLVDLAPGGRFRIHGLEAERGGRAAKAEAAARVRWDRPTRNAPVVRAQSNSIATALEPASDIPMHSAPLRSEPIQSAPANGIANAPDEARARANARHMAYQRGDINEVELAELRAADAVPVKRGAA